MLISLIRALLCIFVLLSAFSSAAAEITACDLIDKAAASQILGRLVARGPTASKYVVADTVKTNCDFAADAPLTVVIVTLSEFRSPSDAKAWADQANTPRDPGVSVETERSMSDAAVWWSGRHSAGYVVRKGARVLEVNIRGVTAGAKPFEITSLTRPQLRQVVLHAIEKL